MRSGAARSASPQLSLLPLFGMICSKRILKFRWPHRDINRRMFGLRGCSVHYGRTRAAFRRRIVAQNEAHNGDHAMSRRKERDAMTMLR